ncbi:hypothetical protein LN042_01620 [Kitasatospora sp. RB6PN24]|uniref:hypothetical protein n=1 Tax=Kitasatospora humi TaxID=2893891 RepID=UPI001E2CA916|nr:hypothetical protein [Kitasatospora humi]MCC9305818.1 hypothetical protein [Kitasatospora humi]
MTCATVRGCHRTGRTGVETVTALRIDDRVITGLHALRDPQKLSRMGRETVLSR